MKPTAYCTRTTKFFVKLNNLWPQLHTHLYHKYLMTTFNRLCVEVHILCLKRYGQSINTVYLTTVMQYFTSLVVIEHFSK